MKSDNLKQKVQELSKSIQRQLNEFEAENDLEIKDIDLSHNKGLQLIFHKKSK